MASNNYAIAKQGFLYKTSLYLKQTRKRWVELHGKYLICKHNRKITEKIDLTTFNDVEFSMKIKGQFELINRKTKQKRIFRANPAKEMYDWVEKILRVISMYQLSTLTRHRSDTTDTNRLSIPSPRKHRSNNQFQHYSPSPQRHKIDFSESTTDRNDVIDISDSTQNGYTTTHTLTPIYDIDNNNNFEYQNELNDAYYKAKTITESQLMEILKDRHIICDSLISVYSKQKQAYIDYAGVLTKHHLCLISPTNYKIWQEFTEKTKINQLMNIQNNNERSRINNEIASKLAKNMNITDDPNKINKIERGLYGRTKKRMKLNI